MLKNIKRFMEESAKFLLCCSVTYILNINKLINEYINKHIVK